MSYNKKALRVDLGKYYKPNPYKKDMNTDPAGLWKFDGPVKVPNYGSEDMEITMDNVNVPVMGIASTGQQQMMMPWQQYTFPGADYVNEIPLAQQGLSVNSIVNTPRSLAYNNKKITKGITTLPEIPIHPPKDEDSNAENLLEIIDPTGYSSWDDVAKAYKKSGVSWETALEVLGALPFLGKIGKSGKVIAGGFGLLQDAIKASKYLPAKEQKAFIDAAYKGYQKYAKIGGKELDKVLGKSTEIIKDNIPLLNPEKWESSSKAINAANKAFKIGKATDAYQAYDQWNPIQLDEGFAQGGAIPELPLNAGRRAYHTWGYTNNDFIVNRQEGGPYNTQLTPEEENSFQYFYQTLPENLQQDDPSYDIRGYWDSEGRPETFNYSQPKEDDGFYHAYSIHGGTGKYLKAPWHPTFQHAVEEDRKIGYRPTVNVKGEVIATENPALTEDYIEADLTPEEIEQYRQGGYVVEDISVPQLTKAQTGMEQEVYRNQDAPEVPIVAQAPDWLKFAREYESVKSKNAFVEEKKKKYLKQNKGLNKLAGLSMDNFPKEVEKNFADEYDYKKNTYVTRKLGKKEGFNPRHRGNWVDELTPGEQQVVANSKYGSKLQPGAWSRTLAGAQELGNAIVKQLPGKQGDVFKYNIPGLTKREQKEIAESPTGALELFSGLDAPTGYNVINFLKNRGLSTGSNYKELPGLLSGELMPNATETEAMAFNPFNYYGLEAIPTAVGKGLVKTGRAADNLVKNAILTGKAKYTAPLVGGLAGSAYGLKEDLAGDSENAKEAGLGLGAAALLGLYTKGKVKPSLEILKQSQKLLDKSNLRAALNTTKKYTNEIEKLQNERAIRNKYNLFFLTPAGEASTLYENFIKPYEAKQLDLGWKANKYFLKKDYPTKGLITDFSNPQSDLAKLQLAEQKKLTDVSNLEKSISNIYKDENKLISKASNMFEPVVKTGTSSVIDFRTGEQIPSEVRLPSTEVTYTKEGNKLLSDFNEIESPIVSEKYPETLKSNRELIENEIVPGSKAFGSSVGVTEGGLKHLSSDIDFLLTESDYNKSLKGKHKHVGSYGPAQQYDVFNGKYGEAGVMDFNIIHEDSKGMVKPVYNQNSPRGAKSLEVELFRQFFPDEFYKQSQIAIKNNKDIQIPMTAKQLLDGVDPAVKTILDSYEAGAGYHLGLTPSTKTKHILKPEIYISFGEPTVVSKAQEQYVKSLVGSTGSIAYQFPESEFSDIDKNMQLLMDMDFLGDIPAVAKDPKKMQLALNDFYIRRSVFNREVNLTKNLNKVKEALTEWNPKSSTHGGNARGHGLNYVEHGFSAHVSDGIIGNLQLNLNPKTSSPAEYVDDIKKKVLGTTELSPSQLFELDKIIEKYLGPQAVKNNKFIKTAKDILNLQLDKSYSNLPFEPRDMFYEISDKLGLQAITDVSSGEYKNSYYTTVLKKIDDSLDALKYTLEKHAPIIKSHSDKKRFYKQLNTNEINFLSKVEDFNKISNVIDTGLVKSKERLETIKENIKLLKEERQKFIEKYQDSKKDKDYIAAEKRLKEIEEEEKLINDYVAKLTNKKAQVKKMQELFLPIGVGLAVVGAGVSGAYELNKKVNLDQKSSDLRRAIKYNYSDLNVPSVIRNKSYEEANKYMDSLSNLYKDASNPYMSPFLSSELKKYIRQNPDKSWWPNFEDIKYKLDPKSKKMRIAAPEKMAPYSKGGTIELELSPDEIKAYQDQGYTIEYLD
jgi:hypothetical protein